MEIPYVLQGMLVTLLLHLACWSHAQIGNLHYLSRSENIMGLVLPIYQKGLLHRAGV